MFPDEVSLTSFVFIRESITRVIQDKDFNRLGVLLVLT